MIRKLLRTEFTRFLLTGFVNTLVGYGLFALFIFLRLHYTLAVLFSTILGILFNFKTYGILVFRDSRNSLILRFFLVYAIIYGLNVASLAGLMRLGFGKYTAGAIVTLPAALLNYLLQKRFVFTKDRSTYGKEENSCAD